MASLRTQITDAVVAALNLITVANGYNTDLGIKGGAQKPKVGANELNVYPTAMVFVPSEDKRFADNNAYGNRLTLQVVLWPELDEGDEAETELDLLISDVERALMLETEKNPPLDVVGATELEVLGHTKTTPVGEVSAELDFVVSYKHGLTDPSEPSA